MGRGLRGARPAAWSTSRRAAVLVGDGGERRWRTPLAHPAGRAALRAGSGPRRRYARVGFACGQGAPFEDHDPEDRGGVDGDVTPGDHSVAVKLDMLRSTQLHLVLGHDEHCRLECRTPRAAEP